MSNPINNQIKSQAEQLENSQPLNKKDKNHPKSLNGDKYSAAKQSLKHLEKGNKPTKQSKKTKEPSKNLSWNTVVTGLTGHPWDIAYATNFQSKRPFLNRLYRGVNSTLGWGAFFINYANNVVGKTVFDLPKATEDKIESLTGTNFEEIGNALQVATPGIPLDESLFYGLSKIGGWSRTFRKLHQTTVKQVLKTRHSKARQIVSTFREVNELLQKPETQSQSQKNSSNKSSPEP